MTAFTGYRAWRIRDWQAGLLGAAACDYAWEGPTISVSPEEVAELPASGGFHAFKTERGASEYLMGYANPSRDPFMVYAGMMIRNPPPSGEQNWALGEVGLFGTVVEHEKGFRASHVVVRSITVSPVWGEEFRKRLADRYQCPVTAWEMSMPKQRPKLLDASAGASVKLKHASSFWLWLDRLLWSDVPLPIVGGIIGALFGIIWGVMING